MEVTNPTNYNPTANYATAPQIQYAGFWRRFAAYLIDSILLSFCMLVVALPFIILFILAAGSANESTYDDRTGAGVLGGFAVLAYCFFYIALIITNWLYFALFESSKYQATPGKMAIGVIVTDKNLQKLSFARATGRFFAKILNGLTLYIGWILIGITEKKQGLHDMVADTLVIIRK